MKIQKYIKHSSPGVAIIFSLLFIAVVLAIVTTLSAIFTPKIKLAYNANKSVTAVYAAESGIEYCLFVVRKSPSPLPTLLMSNGAVVVNSPADCVLPVTSTGTYQGVSRAFEVNY